MLKLTISCTGVIFKHTLNTSLSLHWFLSSAFSWPLDNFMTDKIAQKFETSPYKQNPRCSFLCVMIPFYTEARHTCNFLYFFSLTFFMFNAYTRSTWLLHSHTTAYKCISGLGLIENYYGNIFNIRRNSHISWGCGINRVTARKFVSLWRDN